jgi:homocysteine S-methyltransferase
MSGARPVSVELLPPRTPDMSALCVAARTLREAGATAINLPDGPRASARISNVAAAAILQREVGIEALIHFCCRDRNLLGMQSDLLGAAALGLHNLLVVTGDPPYQGNYPEVTAVFDVDSIGLCNIVDQLNHGLDLGGNPLGARTSFCFGAAWNHSALDPERERARFAWKVKAGVDYFITQPVFDAAQFAAELARLPQPRPPILAGVWPLRSLRNAEFLHSEVPGVCVPAEVLRRMERADARGKAADEGAAIAREIVAELAPLVQGFQLAAQRARPRAAAGSPRAD